MHILEGERSNIDVAALEGCISGMSYKPPPRKCVFHMFIIDSNRLNFSITDYDSCVIWT